MAEGIRPIDWWMLASEALVLLVIAGEAGIAMWCWWRRLSRLANTFHLTFDDGTQSKTIPLNPSTNIHEVAVEILVSETTEMHSFTFRCSATAKGGAVSPRVVSIQGVRDISRIRRSLSDAIDYKGGLLGNWTAGRFMDTGEKMSLLLSLNVAEPWAGFLSFQSYDADHHVRVERCQLSFIQDGGVAC